MSGKVDLYEQDFVRWTEAQAVGLRRAAETRSNLPLDWLNLAEEVESLGRSQRRELRSRLATIIEHLLKLQYSPALEPRIGWIETIGRERREIERLLEDSPSLRGELEQALAAEWQHGKLGRRNSPKARRAGARHTLPPLLGLLQHRAAARRLASRSALM